MSVPPPFFLDTFGDSAITDFACVSPSTDAPIVDHSQNTLDVNPSSNNGEEKSLFENTLDFSSTFSENERVNFSASHIPLYLIHQIVKMPMK